MQKRIQSYISDSQSVLANTRIVLEAVRKLSPIDVLDLSHVGVNQARAVYGIAQAAWDEGVIDRSTFKAAVELANAWLAFDDDVLEVIADAIPVVRGGAHQEIPH